MKSRERIQEVWPDKVLAWENLGRLSDRYISILEEDPAVARIAGPSFSLWVDNASGIAFSSMTCIKLNCFGSRLGDQPSACHILTVESAPPEKINCAAGRASMHVMEDP